MKNILLPLIIILFSLSQVSCESDSDSSKSSGESSAQNDAKETQNKELLEKQVPDEILSFKGLKEDVHIVYTEMNIPHIYAHNLEDLYYASGYQMAKDRYVFMEIAWRFGRGRLGELLGSFISDIDPEARANGLARISDLIYQTLSPDLKMMFEQFAKGMNQYVREVKSGKFPVPEELKTIAIVVGVKDALDLMKEVSAQDITGVLAPIVQQLGFETKDLDRNKSLQKVLSHYNDVAFSSLRKKGLKDDIWNYVAPVKSNLSNPNSLFTDYGTASANPFFQKKPLSLKSADKQLPLKIEASLMDRTTKSLMRFNSLLLKGKDALSFGSNAWAVSREASEDGNAILAGDGHLPLGIPPIVYQACLNTKLLGDGNLNDCGMYFAGLPLMGLGNNENIAWSFTFQRADITDWYKEEIKLNDKGEPLESLFQGKWYPLKEKIEEYRIVDPKNPSQDLKRESWKRWETFDGRMIISFEGKVVEKDYPVKEKESLIRSQADFLVPGDQNKDGKIDAISFDWTGLDYNNSISVLKKFSESKNVREFNDQSKGLVGFGQNWIAADSAGNILFTSFTGIPCRKHLAKDSQGNYKAGANPTLLIDGTKYGSFKIPTKEDGRIDFDAEADPQVCAIPFNEMPAQINPPQNYVFNANNDIGNLSLDNQLFNNKWYLGGPYDVGYRAETIENRLKTLSENKKVTIKNMAALQNNKNSGFAKDFAPFLIESISEAQLISQSSPKDVGEKEIKRLFESEKESLLEIKERITRWKEGNFSTASGVKTFYNNPSDKDRKDAVATMIFNQWYRFLIKEIFDDEDIEFVWEPKGRHEEDLISSAMYKIVQSRKKNSLNISSFNENTGESIFFDKLGSERIETSYEIALSALIKTLETLRKEPTKPGIGGFGTKDMDQWLWGLRHMVKLDWLLAGFVSEDSSINLLAERFGLTPKELPLEENIDEKDPRYGLKGFPRGGDIYTVDVASPALKGKEDFYYKSGPVKRMVIKMKKGGIEAHNIMPGGQSLDKNSPHYKDQAAFWLGNKTLPVRFYFEDVLVNKTKHLKLEKMR